MKASTSRANAGAAVPAAEAGARERVPYTGPERRRTSPPSVERRALTVMDVAKRLSVHRDTVYVLLRENKLRHVRLGKRNFRIDSLSVDAYLDRLFDTPADPDVPTAPAKRAAFDADDFLPPSPRVFR